jgi:hypothetical protein
LADAPFRRLIHPLWLVRGEIPKLESREALFSKVDFSQGDRTADARHFWDAAG